MYVNPFVLGFGTAVLLILIVVFILAIIVGGKKD